MEIKGKVHCFFEQSGTFKREFIKLGIPAEDYDIQNNFGETDHTDDLFQAIEDAYDGKPSLFDNITYDDFIMAFFPCIRFCGISQMNFALATHAQQSLEDGFASILRLTDERNYFYKLITKLVAVTLFRNLRMVIENPWQGQQYLHVWLKQPDLIDENRMRRGDYMIKPTAYWFWNCEPSRGFTYQPKNMSERKKFNIHGQYTGQANVAKGASKTGLCSEERSMISHDYARNFICDFILGIKQEIPHVQLALFDPSQSIPEKLTYVRVKRNLGKSQRIPR